MQIISHTKYRSLSRDVVKFWRHIDVHLRVASLCKYNTNEVHIANCSLAKMDCSESEAKSGENVEATSSVPLSYYAKKLDQ